MFISLLRRGHTLSVATDIPQNTSSQAQKFSEGWKQIFLLFRVYTLLILFLYSAVVIFKICYIWNQLQHLAA